MKLHAFISQAIYFSIVLIYDNRNILETYI